MVQIMGIAVPNFLKHASGAHGGLRILGLGF